MRSAAVAILSLVHADDFRRLLAAPARQRSAHFAVHHVATPPLRRARAATTTMSTELSTTCERSCSPLVDDCQATRWLGVVVPKRHARRAVTRNLLKRQMRAAVERQGAALAGGMWLLRLKQGFAPAQFPSAASAALRRAVRAELDALLGRACAPVAAS